MTTSRLHIESIGIGPPLVLLHGWAMHSGLWWSVVPQLSQHFRLHLVDLPGHGHTPTDVVPSFTADAIARQLSTTFADEAAPIAVLGWSLGGLVAQHWARLAPAQVGRLILSCSTPKFINADDWQAGVEPHILSRFGDELRVNYQLTLKRFLTLQTQGALDAKATLSSLRNQLFARGEPHPQALVDGLKVLETSDSRAWLPHLPQPRLIISGGRDTLTPAAASNWMASYPPKAQHLHIDNAAHAPHWSHPAAFCAAVLGFLSP